MEIFDILCILVKKTTRKHHLFAHSVWLRRQRLHFIAAWRSYANAVLGVVILSICLSVARVLCDKNKQGTADIFILQETAITVVFLEMLPFVWSLSSEWPTPFEKRRLRQISAYHVWTIGDSEKSSITTNIKLTTGFPTSYRLSTYVIPKSPKGWLRKRSFNFLNKIQFQSNKVC